MTETYKFYKESDDRWYIDIPLNDQITKEMCEMVAGADDILDVLSKWSNKITLKVSDTEKLDYILTLEQRTNDIGGGIYRLSGGEVYGDVSMWLCDVTAYLFNGLPETIYFKIV